LRPIEPGAPVLPASLTPAARRRMAARPSRKGFESFLLFGRGLSPGACRRYCDDVQLFNLHQHAGEPPALLPHEAPSRREYRSYLAHLGATVPALATATIRARFTSLRAFDDYLIDLGFRSENTAETIALPKLVRPLPRCLSQDDVRRLLGEGVDSASETAGRDRAVLEFLYATGVRSAELRMLRPESLFLDDHYAVVFGKGSKERVVFFHGRAREALKTYLGDDASRPFVFLAPRGGALSRQCLCQIVQRAARRAGISGRVVPHHLRHAFATHMVEGGADLVSVARMLGHEDLSTLEVYVHLSQIHLREAAARHPRSRRA
jgi:integrase/recombinase XerD